MKLILTYKDLIVSFGLLPIIITLIGVHFLPNTEMLGTGFLLSIAALTYAVVRLKELNFFVIQGTIGIGLCFFLRLFTGYRFIPLNGITPVLEFILLAFAFIHLIAPELYKDLVKRLGFKVYSYMLETKIIVIVSGIHLAILGYMIQNEESPNTENHFFIANIIPVFIYIICLLVNIIGMRLAAQQEHSRYHIIRIAPVYNGKVYLTQCKNPSESRESNHPKWDLPIDDAFEGRMETTQKYAHKILRPYIFPQNDRLTPRLILKYKTITSCHCTQNVLLYILPLNKESDFLIPNGHFFSFDEIMSDSNLFSLNLQKESGHLQMAADIWNQFK